MPDNRISTAHFIQDELAPKFSPTILYYTNNQPHTQKVIPPGKKVSTITCYNNYRSKLHTYRYQTAAIMSPHNYPSLQTKKSREWGSSANRLQGNTKKGVTEKKEQKTTKNKHCLQANPVRQNRKPLNSSHYYTNRHCLPNNYSSMRLIVAINALLVFTSRIVFVSLAVSSYLRAIASVVPLCVIIFINLFLVL